MPLYYLKLKEFDIPFTFASSTSKLDKRELACNSHITAGNKVGSLWFKRLCSIF